MKLPYTDWKNAYESGNTPWRTNEGIENWLIKSGIHSGLALDLGCGTGDQSIWLAQHGFQVEAVDYSKEALAIARQQASRHPDMPVQFFEHDLEDIASYNFLQTKYDLIICKKVIAFLDNQESFLKTVSQKLSGVMIVQVFLAHDETTVIVSDEAELEALFKKNFNIKEKISLPTDRPGKNVTDYYLIPKI